MFDNVGKKIKLLCKINVYVSTLVAMVAGGIIALAFDDMVILFLLGALIGGAIGFLLSWLFSLIIYAFGELCENVYDLKNRTTVEMMTKKKKRMMRKRKTDDNRYDVDDPRYFDTPDEE